MSRSNPRVVVAWAFGLLFLTCVVWAAPLQVHFIDVGQADAILIQTPDGVNILIDAGEQFTSARLIAYLRQQGVSTLDHVIATHPHADHIGGMAGVIKAFDIGSVYMPRATHTTKTYENLLLAIRDKGLRVHEAKAGVALDFGEGIGAQLVAPVASGYKSLNDYSAVLRLTYGETRFLFAGDAERLSETQMLASGAELSADVLKVGHHGSNTSSYEPFLGAVGATYGVIMVGKNNRYGLPHPAALGRLEAAGIIILRTDELGTIVITSDGENLEIIYPEQALLYVPWGASRQAA
jgi:competence protein ComEC